MKKLLFLLFTVPLLAQNPVVPFRSPRVTFTTATGQPLSGGCVFTYQGGTSTPQPTYTDYTGGTPNTNPVALDSTGSATMWLGTNSYKFVAYSAGGTNCSLGSLQWTVDQVPGDAFLNGTISGATITNPAISGGTQTGTAISGVTITNSTVNSTPIGGTSPAAGNFSQLSGVVSNASFSATPVFAAASNTTFIMTLAANVTSSTITGSATGQMINFKLCQNGTGGYTFAWPANFVNAPLMPAQPAACMTPTFFYDGSNWQYLNFLAASSVSAYDNVTWSATPTFAVDPFYIFALTLTGDVTGSSLTGSATGQVISLYLCQDSAGAHLFTWPGSFLNPPSMPQAPNVCITPQFFYNGAGWALLGQPLANSAQAVAFSVTPNFDSNGYNQFSMTLGASVTSSTISGGTFGQISSFNICENSTGGYSFVWPTNVLNAPPITTTALACTASIVIYDGTNWLTVPSSVNSGFTSGIGWVKDPTGHIHQWGHVSGLSTGSCQSVSFNTPFTDASSIGVTATDDFSTGGSVEVSVLDDGGTHSCTAPSTSGFQLWVSSGGNGAWWSADGN